MGTERPETVKIGVILPKLEQLSDSSLVAVEDFRATTAGGPLIHAAFCLLIARKT